MKRFQALISGISMTFLLLVCMSPSLHASPVPPLEDPATRNQPDALLQGVGDLILSDRLPEAQARIQSALQAYREKNDQHGEAICFLLLGMTHFGREDAPSARSGFEKSAEISESSGYAFDSWMAHWMLADFERSQGNLDKAITLHQKALSLIQMNRESSRPFSLRGFTHLAAAFGLPSDALSPALMHSEIAKPILLWMAEAISRDSFGAALLDLGRFEEAELELSRASELSQRFGGLFDTWINTHLGDLRRRQWRFDEARELYQKALSGVESSPALLFRDEWAGVRTMEQLAEIEMLSGRLEEALAWNEKALVQARARGHKKREASILQSRGNLLLRHEHLGEAESVFNKAMDISRESGDTYRQALIQSDLGSLWIFGGQYGKAVWHLESSVRLFHTLDEPYVEGAVWILLSEAYLLIGSHENARVAAEKARELTQKSGFRLGEALTKVVTEGDKMMSGQGTSTDLDKALVAFFGMPEAGGLMLAEDPLKMYREVLALQSSGAGNSPARPDPEADAIQGNGILMHSTLARMTLGKLHFQSGEFAEARNQWSRALEETSSQDLKAQLLGAVGATYLKEGKLEDAIRHLTEAIGQLEHSMDVRVEELVAGYWGSERRFFYDLLVEVLVREGRTMEAFDFAERARARAFLQILGNKRLKAEHGADTQLFKQAEALRTQLLDWDRQLSLSPLAEQKGRMEDLRKARELYQSLLVRLKVSNPEYSSISKVEPLEVDDLQRDLPSDVTLISYFVSPSRIHAWVIDQETFHHIPLTMSPDDLRRAVCWAGRAGRIRGAESSVSGCQKGSASPEELYDKLITPLQQKIRHHKLILVPHGPLHYVPFAALRDPKNSQYLIQQHTLVYSPSASTLRFLRGKESPVEGRTLVLGDPANPNRTLPPLPAAKREALSVARSLRARPLLGKKAVESLIYDLDGKVDLVHIAAHGIYNPASPLFSRIALAPGPGHDGNLDVHEILSKLDLTGVNLVVLSACQTAVGERSGGDEIVGLTRAVLYAGSPGVISTLWNIHDKASAILMEEFYRNLLAGASAAEALRQAQLAMLSNPDYSDPYFWAAFNLTGDPQGRWLVPESVQ